MKDIHNHILFGIDDGSENLEESIQIILKAVNNGYTKLILTPHYRVKQNYTCANHEKYKIFNQLQEEVEKRNIPIKLYLGNEITVDEDFFYYLKTNQFLSLNNSRYLLLELPFNRRFDGLEELFEEVQKMGLVPIIAHPERYQAYDNLDEFQEWIKKGILFQGNIGSLYGKYGIKEKEKLEGMLKRHMIHFIGSDIHHEQQKSYSRIHDVIAKIEELTGSREMAMELVDGNVDKVIHNEKINAYPPRKKKIKLKFVKVNI